MSDNQNNPYASPQTEIDPVKPLASYGILTGAMIGYLRSASPWLRFVGITGFIICGISLISGLVMVIGLEALPLPLWGSAAGIGLLVYLAGLAILMFFPFLFIFRFGQKIKSYLHNGNEADLELAFKNNKSLWVFTGVLSIIFLGFTALFIIMGTMGVLFTAMF